jgi:hypothetical protein
MTYNGNDPDDLPNPDLIMPLERYHNNHDNKHCRQYKLLDKYLFLDYHE